jgi:hypothetical protein
VNSMAPGAGGCISWFLRAWGELASSGDLRCISVFYSNKAAEAARRYTEAEWSRGFRLAEITEGGLQRERLGGEQRSLFGSPSGMRLRISEIAHQARLGCGEAEAAGFCSGESVGLWSTMVWQSA